MMHRSTPNKSGYTGRYRRLMLIVIVMLGLLYGCSDDGGAPLNLDETIPVSVSWTINSVLHQDPADRSDLDAGMVEDYIEPRISVVEHEGRVHIAYYDVNPDPVTRDDYPYRLMYKSFNAVDFRHLSSGNTVLERVLLIDDDPRNRAGLSMSVAGGKAVIAYPVFKIYIVLDDFDMSNQGDVMIAVRDGANTWRHEIGAYGYVPPERNPVFRDGLAQSDFWLTGDEGGQLHLSFQFYYEGIDSYNFDYPDLRYIAQPVNAFDNADVNAVADLEENVEGNVYQSFASGQQSFHGGCNHLIIDGEGQPVVFYYVDDTINGNAQDRGLRFARKVGDVWQAPQWIESGVTVSDVRGAVRSDGGLFVAYTVIDIPDFIDNQTELPSIVKYAEQIDVITGYDVDGGEIHGWEWRYNFVNYNTICGADLTLALDSEDRPVVAYYDHMNFTLNRFFSRIKVSRRNDAGAWEVSVIDPEAVGLSNHTSPYDVLPGSTDIMYIGKHNHLWLDAEDRIYLASYSTVNKKLFVFAMNP